METRNQAAGEILAVAQEAAQGSFGPLLCGRLRLLGVDFLLRAFDNGF
jgi:hypothetical protein